MTPVVIDCSVFLAWCLADEDEPAASRTVERVIETGGIVPRIWWYELRNALSMNERRGRITAQQVADTLADSAALGIEIDDRHDEASILGLARQHGLSVYDAAYLEVAYRRGLPLATLDQRLSAAAAANEVAVIGMEG